MVGHRQISFISYTEQAGDQAGWAGGTPPDQHYLVHRTNHMIINIICTHTPLRRPRQIALSYASYQHEALTILTCDQKCSCHHITFTCMMLQRNQPLLCEESSCLSSSSSTCSSSCSSSSSPYSSSSPFPTVVSEVFRCS